MANDGAINPIINGLERTIVRKNYEQQYANRTAVLQNPIVNKICSVYTRIEGLEYIRQTPVITPAQDNHAGLFSTDPGGGFFFERVWVEPLLIALQFITEDVEREIKIWNAYRSKTVQTTSVVVLNQEGTDLTYPSLPDTINIFGDAIYTLDIYGDGPPLQDTSYTLTIDGKEYVIEITGIRVIPFDLDPNWEANLQFTYEFATTIWSNDKFTEQRRPMSRESWFTITASFDASGSRNRKIMNLLGYGKDKVFGIPVFTEKMTPVSASAGSSTITVNEDFTYFYNLKSRAGYVIIVDHDAGQAEIKVISSLTGTNQIDLTQPISAAFDLKYTYVYPCMFVIINSFSGSNITDDFDNVKINFKEFKSG